MDDVYVEPTITSIGAIHSLSDHASRKKRRPVGFAPPTAKRNTRRHRPAPPVPRPRHPRTTTAPPR